MFGRATVHGIRSAACSGASNRGGWCRVSYSRQGLSEVVKHGETMRIFVGNVNEEELQSFVNEERLVPEVY